MKPSQEAEGGCVNMLPGTRSGPGTPGILKAPAFSLERENLETPVVIYLVTKMLHTLLLSDSLYASHLLFILTYVHHFSEVPCSPNLLGHGAQDPSSAQSPG